MKSHFEKNDPVVLGLTKLLAGTPLISFITIMNCLKNGNWGIGSSAWNINIRSNRYQPFLKVLGPKYSGTIRLKPWATDALAPYIAMSPATMALTKWDGWIHFSMKKNFNLMTSWWHQHDDIIKWKHFPCYWPFVLTHFTNAYTSHSASMS